MTDNKKCKTEVKAAPSMEKISIRLQKKVIAQYKAIAEEKGVGYQTLMRADLNRFLRERATK